MKAILILDKMPDRCGHCRLSAMVKYYAMCMVTGLECAETGRPEWCPLQEVEPVKHGHWKALRGDWDGLYECQDCGSRFGTSYYYCPVCGVKMDCVDGGAE